MDGVGVIDGVLDGVAEGLGDNGGDVSTADIVKLHITAGLADGVGGGRGVEEGCGYRIFDIVSGIIGPSSWMLHSPVFKL